MFVKGFKKSNFLSILNVFYIIFVQKVEFLFFYLTKHILMLYLCIDFM